MSLEHKAPGEERWDRKDGIEGIDYEIKNHQGKGHAKWKIHNQDTPLNSQQAADLHGVDKAKVYFPEATSSSQNRDRQNNFSEAKYLEANPDVAAELATGQSDFSSAWDHYNRAGRDEGRSGNYWKDQGQTQTTFESGWEGGEVTERRGSAVIVGQDPNKVTLDLADKNTFMATKYAAPGREGEFKSGDDKTSGIDYSTVEGKRRVQELETQFVDELYGTTDAVKTDGMTGAIDRGVVTEEWGLDLARVMTNEDGSKIKHGDANFYETVTRGKVDWEFYRTDNAFKSAFESFNTGDKIGDKTWTEGYGFDDQEGITNVDEIRALNPQAWKTVVADGQGKDAWKTTWEGKYEPSFDPDTTPKYTPTPLDVTSTGYSQPPPHDQRILKAKKWSKAKPLPTAAQYNAQYKQLAADHKANVVEHVNSISSLKIVGE